MCCFMHRSAASLFTVEGIAEGQGCFQFDQSDSDELNPLQIYIDLRDEAVVDESGSNNIIEICKAACNRERYDVAAVRVGICYV